MSRCRTKTECDKRLERLEADRRRLEWLVDQEASVCYVLGTWAVWYDEETHSEPHNHWRDAIDEAMKKNT